MKDSPSGATRLQDCPASGLSMGRSTGGEDGLSEQRKNRGWSAQQKIEIVLAGLRGDRSVRDVCREHAISEALFYSWREKLLEAAARRWRGRRSARRAGVAAEAAELERALGPKT